MPARRFLALVLCLGVWLSGGASAEAEGPAGESVSIAILDDSGALLPDATVAWRIPGGALRKARREPFGSSAAPLAGERVQLLIEHPHYGRSAVELRVPERGARAVVVRLGAAGARAYLVSPQALQAVDPFGVPAVPQAFGAFGELATAGATAPGGAPVTCGTGVGCQLPDQLGHGAGTVVAVASDSNPLAAARMAGNFRPLATGTVQALCWWGVYVDYSIPTGCGPGTGDAFQVTYYADDAGGARPGSVLAGPLTVTLTSSFATGNKVDTSVGTVNEFQFEGSHAPVSVTAGECHWVELVNATSGECLWLWQTAPPGDGRAAQDIGAGYTPVDFDLAFCVDVATDPLGCPVAATNDDCEDAQLITGTGFFPFDNSAATTDGPAHAACDEFGSQETENDVWFLWIAPSTGIARVSNCGGIVDAKLVLYDGYACPPLDADVIDCNDDSCGPQATVVGPVVAGQDYLIRVGTSPGMPGGVDSIAIDYVVVPDNDLCEDAVGPLAVPGVVSGSTLNANPDPGLPECAGISSTSPGVWYTVVGTGTSLTASLCDPATAFDTKLSVFCGECGGPSTCIAANDQFCGDQSQVTWCTEPGALYRILVHGFGGASGAFDLALSEDGQPCVDPVPCAPTGACCGTAGCSQASALDCGLLGGSYAGDGSLCAGVTYSGPGARYARSPFTDVSGLPGAVTLTLGDDDGVVVPLGFSFRFYNAPETSVGVSSNGYLTFGSVLDAFENQALPTAGAPDGLIAPLWDDLDPTAGGSLCYVTLGTAPERLFVAQWKDVPQFGVGDANTFQAVLFERGSRISLRYGAVTPEAFGGDYTVGVEDASGSSGTAFPGPAVRAGRSFELRFDHYAGACLTAAPQPSATQYANEVPR